MNYKQTLLRLVLPTLLLTGLGLEAVQARPYEVDRIVAVVNDDVIVLSELHERMRAVQTRLLQKGSPPPDAEVLQKQVLERLILSRLQLQKARRSGVKVDDFVVNRAVARIAKRNGLSLTEFRDILEKDGLDFLKFRQQLRDELTIARLRQKQIDNRVVVNDREVEDFLSTQAQQGNADTEFRLSHILISVPEGASPEQIAQSKDKAAKVVAQLREGADFSNLAAAVSDGKQALEGGDLGWRKASQLPTLFVRMVNNMNKGEIAEATRSASGFHIIQLADLRHGKRLIVKQTRARHILIRPDDLNSNEDVEIRLNQLKERIENGEDFAELARAHSQDSASAVEGGELGWVSPGDTVPRFEANMDAQDIGGLSKPFRSQFGWHIVQVLERREHDSTDDVRKSQARQAIRERKIEDEAQTWLRRLRDEAYVEYRLDE